MSPPLIVVFGGDTLALAVCDTLASGGSRVVVVWKRDEELAAAVDRRGGTYVERLGEEDLSLQGAGIADAVVAMALTEDDHENLSFALAARNLNPAIRIVMRQFNRTLGRKIEQALPNCSVVSLSSLSAAMYAGAAVDRDCFFGVAFPAAGGRLLGFMERTADRAAATGENADDAEKRLDARIVACDGDSQFDRARIFEENDRLTIFGCVEPREFGPSGPRDSPFSRILRRARGSFRGIARPDPVVRGVVLAGIAVFFFATLFFSSTMRLGFVTSAYFVLSTMTTTGYGDISPGRNDERNQIVAMLLMIAGLTFSGTFIALLSARLADARYVATQGLRRVTRRGHIVVCGAGNVGSRVIDRLIELRRSIVVVELEPKAETIARSRAGDFQLLTGDASKDATLDLCNIPEAAAVIAITNSDTMNLEIALGTRARSETCHVVMRVQHKTFENSVRHHFGFTSVYGTAALAAPLLAGLAFGPEIRGFVRIGDRAFGAIETVGLPTFTRLGRGPTFVPLAAWGERGYRPLASFDDVAAGERVLSLGDVPEGVHV
jgi:Trk K+ transport system NAD-binding subunit